MTDRVFKGLQDKITTIEEFIKCPNENSCALILDSIFSTEKMLETSLKVAKKNLRGPLVACNGSIFDAVRQCVVLEIDNYSDAYILTDSFDIPPDYTCILSAPIIDSSKWLPFTYYGSFFFKTSWYLFLIIRVDGLCFVNFISLKHTEVALYRRADEGRWAGPGGPEPRTFMTEKIVLRALEYSWFNSLGQVEAVWSTLTFWIMEYL